MVCFNIEDLEIDGYQLDFCCREPQNEISVCTIRNELPRWYFKQTILMKMKSQAESIPKLDFPTGRTSCLPCVMSRREAAARSLNCFLGYPDIGKRVRGHIKVNLLLQYPQIALT